MSGLLGEYHLNNADRSLSFVRSVERYSALTDTTEESGGMIGLENWKCVFFSQYIRCLKPNNLLVSDVFLMLL